MYEKQVIKQSQKSTKMKKVILSLAVVFTLATTFVSCKETKKEETSTEEVAPAEEMEATPAAEEVDTTAVDTTAVDTTSMQ
ncbi:hypothetical protein ACG2LH_04145 [Zhouia sp. PK063]|uniref:hypothetical protein n=1 Tax=Zhouia sp. PK063 TaxID=3373602 RepID=UPI0037A9D133